MTAQERALTFLKTKPLQHLVHLKFLHLYGDHLECWCVNEGADTGVLLNYPPELVSWDSSAYSVASRVFMPAASNVAMAQKLCEAVIAQTNDYPIVCKFCDTNTRQVFAQAFHLQPTQTVISYTTSLLNVPAATDDVVISHQLDERNLKLYLENGYSVDELKKYFAEGAMAFTLYEQDEPLCSCMIYQNFGDVWEIGGLNTVERARRKGYARQVVNAALKEILNRGWIPRYQAQETNLASLRLAESLGMTVCLRFEHYLARLNSA
jgi:GNAT superfamily N-acetyltransferase